MTENGKIFLVKNTILNILALQELSIGLSLYIIKDIKQLLELIYNNIVQQEISLQKQEKEKEQKKDDNEQIIDMTSLGVHPVKWIPEKEENEDQAD